MTENEMNEILERMRDYLFDNLYEFLEDYKETYNECYDDAIAQVLEDAKNNGEFD